MADSIEIRLDQLTDAIKGLYAKSSMSQGEIYNALTSLSQRYENLTSVSSEKIAQTLIGEFRKTIDVKYGQTNQFIKDLENSLRSFMANSSNQNPRVATEINKLLSDTANMHAKLNAQDSLLQKLFLSVEKSSKDGGNTAELAKLSENFTNFTRGFENITLTLNKNFAEFLTQVRENSTKKEYEVLKGDIGAINSNINTVVSTVSTIETKYQDLVNLINSMKQKDGLFDDALREVKQLCSSIAQAKNQVDPTPDIQALGADIKNHFEAVKFEIQKIVAAQNDTQVKTELNSLVNNFQGVHSNLQNINLTMGALSNDIKDIHSSIGEQTARTQADIERFLSIAKEDVTNLVAGLRTFKQNIENINSGNIKLLQEPLERALNELKNQDLGRNIQELAGNIRGISIDIQNSIQNIQMNLNTMNSNPGFQILNQISETLPTIASKLETIRAEFVSENTTNLSQLKNSLITSLDTFKGDLSAAVERIEVDTRSINIDAIDTLKIDLQKLSDHIVDSVDSLNEKADSEFDNLKTDFQEFTNKQADTIDKITEKLAAVEICVENLSQDTIYKLNDRIDAGNTQNQETITNIKTELFEKVSNIDKSNKETLGGFESKIDKIINDFTTQSNFNTQNKEEFQKAVADLENKVECANLQQIHNAKELLDEIQASGNAIAAKLSLIEENGNSSNIAEDIAKVYQKLKDIEESDINFNEELKNIKEQIEQKLKDNVQKIAVLIEQKEPQVQYQQQDNSNFENLNSKIQEYMSNLEYFKGNISQEIKENLSNDFSRLHSNICENTKEELLKLQGNVAREVRENFSEELLKLQGNISQEIKENLSNDFSRLHSNICENTKENLVDELSKHDYSSNIEEIKNGIQEQILILENFKNDISREIKENVTNSCEDSKENLVDELSKTQNNILEEFRESLEQELSKIGDAIKKIRTSDENSNYSYTLEDIESDLAKMRMSIEKNASNPDEWKVLLEKSSELKTIGLESIKISRDTEAELGHLTGWIKDTLDKLDDISDKVNDIQSTGFEDIKTRLLQSEKSKAAVAETNAKIENALRVIIKNMQAQDNKIAELTKKAEIIAQTQQDSFNPAQFIDVFYENMTQTKMLSNRVEIMEDKINSIQSAVERLINYVEQ